MTVARMFSQGSGPTIVLDSVQRALFFPSKGSVVPTLAVKGQLDLCLQLFSLPGNAEMP